MGKRWDLIKHAFTPGDGLPVKVAGIVFGLMGLVIVGYYIWG